MPSTCVYIYIYTSIVQAYFIFSSHLRFCFGIDFKGNHSRRREEKKKKRTINIVCEDAAIDVKWKKEKKNISITTTNSVNGIQNTFVHTYMYVVFRLSLLFGFNFFYFVFFSFFVAYTYVLLLLPTKMCVLAFCLVSGIKCQRFCFFLLFINVNERKILKMTIQMENITFETKKKLWFFFSQFVLSIMNDTRYAKI